MTTNYLILTSFWSTYFVDNAPAIPEEKPFQGAYQDTFVFRKEVEVKLIPRVSFTKEGQYYRKHMETVWESSFEDWSKQEGKCWVEDVDENTKIYYCDKELTGWFIALTAQGIKDLKKKYKYVSTQRSDTHLKNNKSLEILVVGISLE